ncbi:DUF1428 domain-containing protein [Roseibium marinum]|uniref:Uncharacterized protein YbaA (DUF1428 family) n=1 Tax=Roseibium marinum TaxID=281252 RepID=A0A2S3UUU5_9HYPH|nr:DUF1428 domain-containing protein [Roseibium marinum]POF31498.1 uncharacterized protein YbaA (DUF1428 family) [Roseibium marinum]
MPYIDGFVAAVPTARKDDYLRFAKKSGPYFRKYGALKIFEAWGDDIPAGEVTSFPMAVKLKADETVVFSWILWPSKEVRDEGMKKVMEDPEMIAMGPEMPFDGKRMIFGGFEMLLEG